MKGHEKPCFIYAGDGPFPGNTQECQPWNPSLCPNIYEYRKWEGCGMGEKSPHLSLYRAMNTEPKDEAVGAPPETIFFLSRRPVLAEALGRSFEVSAEDADERLERLQRHHPELYGECHVFTAQVTGIREVS